MRTLITLSLFFFIQQVNAQKLSRNEVDKFTKISVKETSWEALSRPFTRVLMQRVKSMDGNIYIEFSITYSSIFRVDLDDEVIFLLTSGKTVPVKCVRGGIPSYTYSKYGSHYNLHALYKLTEANINDLLSEKVTDVRLGMGNEFDTFDHIKEKNAEKLQKALILITK